MSTPGTILPMGIVLIDEPAAMALSTFANNGEVLLAFNCRPGGNCGQVIIGLTPNQAVQLAEALHKYDDICLRAIADGKGGARFAEKADP